MSPVTRRSSASGNFQRGAGDVVAEQPRPLKAAMQCVALRAGIVDAGDAARLDRIGGHSIDDETLLDHVSGGGKRGIGLGLVAGLIEISLVVRAIAVKLRRAFFERIARRHHSLAAARNRRQRPRRRRAPDRACRRPPPRPDSRRASLCRSQSPAAAADTSRCRRASCTAPSTAAGRARRRNTPRR